MMMGKHSLLFFLWVMVVLLACNITKKYSQLPKSLSLEEGKVEQHSFVLVEHNNLGKDTQIYVEDESIVELLEVKMDAILKDKQTVAGVPNPNNYQLRVDLKLKNKTKGKTTLYIKGVVSPEQTPFLRTIILEVL